MFEFTRMMRLPPYVFAEVNTLKMKLRHKGEDIIDPGIGNTQRTKQAIRGIKQVL